VELAPLPTGEELQAWLMISCNDESDDAYFVRQREITEDDADNTELHRLRDQITSASSPNARGEVSPPRFTNLFDTKSEVHRLRHTESSVEDTYYGLVRVFGDRGPPKQATRPLDPSLAVLRFAQRQRPKPEEALTVATLSRFSEDFFGLCPVLENLDWNNVIAAGGAILHTLLAPPLRWDSHAISVGGKMADIDLFFCGLDYDEATEKLKEIHDLLLPYTIDVQRTLYTVTWIVLNENGNKAEVQVILYIASTKAAVIANFDLDCCQFLFDGHEVWATQRAVTSLQTGANTYNPAFAYKTLAGPRRFMKYATRGFALSVPFKYTQSGTELQSLRPFTHLRDVQVLDEMVSDD
jgi:hypothetical protein